MFRIDDPSAAVTLPTPEAAGTEGYFTEGVPGVTPATKVRASWLNALQESLRAIVAGTSVAISKTDYGRVWASIRRVAGGFASTMTATGTMNVDQAGLVTVAAAANMTLTLPAANGAGGVPIRFHFVRTDTAGFTATLQRAGADLIEGLTTMPLANGQRLMLVSDGVSAWRVQGAGAVTGTQTFSTSGTFTVPPGVWRVRVKCWGGGGGGGGSFGAGSAGSGAGAGAYAEGIVFLSPGSAHTVTVGAGGPGGGGAPTNGTSGGTSSFGAFISATGGVGGLAASGAIQGASGAGGTPSGGNILGVSGDAGGSAYAPGTGMIGAVGGGVTGSRATPPSSSAIATNGFGGIYPGGGAGGGYLAGSGGNGAAGLVIVEW